MKERLQLQIGLVLMGAFMAKGKGTIRREFILELVKRVQAEKSQGQAAGNPGGATSRRSLKGTGEPTQAALEKLSAYLGVSVAWLRGNFIASHGRIEFNVAEPTALCAKCGGALQASPEGFLEVFPDGTEVEGDGILRIWPCTNCCKESTLSPAPSSLPPK